MSARCISIQVAVETELSTHDGLQAFILHSHSRGACGGSVLGTMGVTVLEDSDERSWRRPGDDGSVV